MATVDPELAISYAEEGMPHVERAQPHLQAGFFHNIAWAYFQADLFAEAERYSRRALELFANDDPHRMSSLHAHAFIRWKRLGDLEGLLAGLEQLLPYTETTAPEGPRRHPARTGSPQTVPESACRKPRAFPGGTQVRGRAAADDARGPGGNRLGRGRHHRLPTPPSRGRAVGRRVGDSSDSDTLGPDPP